MATRILIARVGVGDDAERIALPVSSVVEVIDAPAITPLPLTPRGVLGQCAWRREWVAVLDPRLMLGVAPSASIDGPGVVLVLGDAESRFALRVDDVEDVRELAVSERRPLPAGVDQGRRLESVLQSHEGLVAVVDMDALRAAAVATLQLEVGG